MMRMFSGGTPSIWLITPRWLTMACEVSYSVNDCARLSYNATEACSSMGLCVSTGVV